MQKINDIKKNQLLRLLACMIMFFATDIAAKSLFKENKPMQVQPLVVSTVPEMEIPQEELAKKKGLLIFLDDSEINKLGAASYTFLIALYQEASPIIVSSSLLYTLFEHVEKDDRSVDVLMKEASMEREAYYLRQSETINFLLKEDVVNSRISFKRERWIIKKIDDSLYLLIPQKYLDSLNINKNKIEKIRNVIDVPSDVELQLGLKVNHMETIDISTIKRPIYQRLKRYFLGNSKFGDYLIDSLDNVFCKKNDYREKKIDIPEWIIFIGGHGLVNYSIVHLSFDGFKKLLHFLENAINTRLLVVASCYVAGTNADKIYGNIKSETQQYYSFPIIVQGLNDVSTIGAHATSYVYSSSVWMHDQEKPLITEEKRLNTDINFVNFFTKAKKLEGNYSEIVQPITINFIENTPQIKLPGIEWFSVIEADKKIVSIGSILAKTRDPQKPLDIVSFFKKDPEIILLYTDDIPFELIINPKKLKAIISMVSSGLKENDWVHTIYGMNKLPSRANFLIKLDRWLIDKAKIMAAKVSSHLIASDSVRVIQRIKKISSKNRTFEDIVNWFKIVSSTNGLKWVFIDEIQDMNDIIFKDILILGKERDMRVYFKNEDVLFVEIKKGEYKKVKSDSEYEKFYQERMHIIKEQYPELSAKAKEARQEITSEQIKNIENVLIKQRERQMREAKKLP